MDQLRDRERLAAEAGDELLVVGEVLGEDLDRDGPLEDPVGRPVDGRHAAGAEPVAELVAVGDRRVHRLARVPAAGDAAARRAARAARARLTAALVRLPVGGVWFGCSVGCWSVVVLVVVDVSSVVVGAVVTSVVVDEVVDVVATPVSPEAPVSVQSVSDEAARGWSPPWRARLRRQRSTSFGSWSTSLTSSWAWALARSHSPLAASFLNSGYERSTGCPLRRAESCRRRLTRNWRKPVRKRTRAGRSGRDGASRRV